MKKVLVFGTFDPLHEGHQHLLRQAKALGEFLTVVVARDAAVRMLKSRPTYQSEKERAANIRALAEVDEVLLGDKNPTRYQLLKTLSFDVLALGYDQEPTDDATVRRLLQAHDKEHVDIVRLLPYRPDQHKSSLLRPDKTSLGGNGNS